MTSNVRALRGLVGASLLLSVTGLLMSRLPAQGAPPAGRSHALPSPVAGRAGIPGDAASPTDSPPALRQPSLGPVPSGAATSGGRRATSGATDGAGAPADDGGAGSDEPTSGCSEATGGAVTHAPGAGRTVALTFDDGPGDDTAALLDVLRKRHVRATFFVVGANANARPGLVTREAADGHLIGDHTWHHVYPRQVPGGWTSSYLRAEMTRTNRVVSAATGRPVCWFRPPGGFLPTTLLPTAHALGMRVALWSVDPQDWQLQGAHAGSARPQTQLAQTIVSRVSAGLAQQHPVILLHDGGGSRRASVAAVARIIDLYRAHGYRFVRLDGGGG
jgi:peptidoglycan-N-acetylglucosamine deacetylase